MWMDLDLTNDGQFALEYMNLNIFIPDTGYNYDDVLSLLPGQSTNLLLSTAIPEMLSAGTHKVDVRLELDNYTTRSFEFVVPESELLFNLDDSNYDAGDWVGLGIENIGGVDTSADYIVSIMDKNEVSVLYNSGMISLMVSSPRTIDFMIPVNILDGEYHLFAEANDTLTGKSTRLTKVIQISGLMAGLEVATDKQIYHSSDSKTAFADINVSQGNIQDGTLNLRVIQSLGQQKIWTTQQDWESGEINGIDTESLPGDVTVVPTYKPGLEHVESIGGFVQDVYKSGNYVYLCTRSNLEILDVKDPLSPTRVGYCPTPGIAHKVHIFDGYAYVADGGGGLQFGNGALQIIDVSDPSNPHIVHSWHTPGSAYGVYVMDGYAYVGAYVASGSSILQVIDVSDPHNPFLVGSQKTSGSIYDIHVVDGYAYLASYDRGLQIIDVSDPANLSRAGACYTPNHAYEVYVVDNYAYVADVYYLWIIDVSDPGNPSVLGSWNTWDIPGRAYGVYVNDGYAYVADDFAGLKVINVSDPGNPYVTGSCDTPDYARGVYAVNGYAYVADLFSLQVIDVSDYGNPSVVGSWHTPGYAHDVHVVNSYAYLAGNSFDPQIPSSLQVIDVSDPGSPSVVGSCNTGSALVGVHVVDGHAYMASDSGLQIIDISDPVNPSVVGFCDTPGIAWQVYVADGYAYVADINSGLQVIDVSDPGNPSTVGSIPDPARGVYVVDGYAYVCAYVGGDSGLQVIDVSDPNNPSLVGYCSTPGYSTTGNATYGVYVIDDYAYVTEYGAGLQVIDVSDPGNPFIVGSWDTPGNASEVHVVNGYAYVADGGSIQVIDVSNPGNPSVTIDFEIKNSDLDSREL